MNGRDSVVAMGMVAAAGITVITLAKAFAQRIAGRTSTSQREVDAMRDEIDQLHAELDAVHARLGDVDEIQSRLDFAERVLAQGRAKDALPGGRS